MSIDQHTIRLFLHVLGATVWVGGQITLAGLLPVIRTADDDFRKRIARQFQRVAWPFFAVALITGVWNIIEADAGDRSTSWNVALMLKLLIVAASGISAWMHTRTTSRSGLAVWGALGGATALAALLFGAILSTNV